MKTGNWSKVMETEKVETEQESCLMMKRFLSIAISGITYLRAILEEDAFENRKLDDIHLKIISKKSSDPHSIEINKSMKGVFDAIEKKYLKDFYFILYTDQTDVDGSVYEVYHFQLSYSDGVIGLSKSKNCVDYENKVYDSTTKLLRNIFTMTQDLEQLPTEIFMTVRLAYYDHTPDDYEPPGFIPSTIPENMEMDQEYGRVDTHHHGMKASGMVGASLKRNSDCYNVGDSLTANITHSGKYIADSDSSAAGVQGSLPGINGDSLQVNCTTTVNRPQMRLNCLCRVPTQEVPLIQCSACHHYSHAVCYRIYTAVDIQAVTQRVCPNCYSGAIPCFNEKMMDKVNDERFISKLSLKLVLYVIYMYNLAAVDQELICRLGIQFDIAGHIMDHLRGKNLALTREDGATVVNWELLPNRMPMQLEPSELKLLVDIVKQQQQLYIGNAREKKGEETYRTELDTAPPESVSLLAEQGYSAGMQSQSQNHEFNAGVAGRLKTRSRKRKPSASPAKDLKASEDRKSKRQC